MIVFSALTSEALGAIRLLQAKIAFGAVNSVDDLVRHPQLRRASVVTPSGDGRAGGAAGANKRRDTDIAAGAGAGGAYGCNSSRVPR